MENLQINEKKRGSLAEDIKKKGNSLFLKKKYQLAISTYEQALAQLVSEETRLKSTIYSNIGVCLFKLTKYKSALESFSKAIEVDPSWETPFLKRSEVMEQMKQRVKTGEQTDKELKQVAQHRSKADIIVDLTQTQSKKKVGRQMIYNDLDKAIAEGKEGGKIFLEAGNYVSKSKSGFFVIEKHLSIIGANVCQVIIQSNFYVYHDLGKIFRGGPTYFKNIKFMRNMETEKDSKCGLFIGNGVDIIVEDCWFSAENLIDASEFYAIKLIPTIMPKNTKKGMTPNQLKAELARWYPGSKFKDGKLKCTPVICTFRYCFVTDSIENAIWLEGDTCLCTMENCYIEGDVSLIRDSKIKVANCHVMSVTNQEKNINSNVNTRFGASADFIGSFLTKQRPEQINSEIRVPAIQYADKTRGNIKNCFFLKNEEGVQITNSPVKVESNLFSSGLGVNIDRKSSNSSILCNIFNDCDTAICLRDGAQPLIKFNKLNLCTLIVRDSSNPNIFENIFTGEISLKVNPKQLPGILYNNGSGLCANNSFINFQNPLQPPIGITDNLISQGVGPRLNGNKFMDCFTAAFCRHHAGTRGPMGHFFIRSSEDETTMNNIIGNKGEKSANRMCTKCKKYVPCVLCKQCKMYYYCGEQCQKQDWDSHQSFCTSYAVGGKERCRHGSLGCERQSCSDGQ